MINDNRTNLNIKNQNMQNINTRYYRQPTKNNTEIYQNAKANSINKPIQKYKPTTKKVAIKIIALALSVGLAISSICAYKEYKNYSNLDSYIVEMVMPQKDGGNIISQTTERNNPNTFYYDTAQLARNIVKCDPEYFDLIIYNAYTNMDYNRTKNMNQLFEDLRTYSYNISETNPELYYKIQNIKDFNDYLIKIKCVDESNQASLEKFEKNGEYLYEYFEESLKNNYGGKTK